MHNNDTSASLILAAGRGSRMAHYSGNKTLLPLVPEQSPFDGKRPILLEILNNLPKGPKAMVVNHKKEAVMATTEKFNLTYCEQPVLNGTGGALLAGRQFLETVICDHVIITMGDVPLVRPETFIRLLQKLKNHQMAVLGFNPLDKKQYGVLETVGDRVCKITEWKYWRTYPEKEQASLSICNSGIYAAHRQNLLYYLGILAQRPHVVQKKIKGKITDVKEFFITDIVEYMGNDGLPMGYIIGDEEEVMGVDDLTALKKAQKIYKERDGFNKLR